MKRFWAICMFLACSACTLEIEGDLDSGLLMIRKIDAAAVDPGCVIDAGHSHPLDSGVNATQDASVDAASDAGVHVNPDSSVADASIDSSVDSGHQHTVDAAVDASQPMDAAQDSGHSVHDAGVTVEFPAGSEGSSQVRIAVTDEDPTPGTSGEFRTVCDYSHMGYNDPIVYPGQPGASHLHTFFGNTGTDAFSTAESLRNTGNSTCRGGIANRTAYWVPTMLDGQNRPIAPVSSDFYYKTGFQGLTGPQIRPFPQGLRMIKGDVNASSKQDWVEWGCRDNYIGKFATIQDCPDGDFITLTIVFPQCWDGVRLDSPDHRAHMSHGNGRGCPSTHPVPIPEITYNIKWRRPTSGIVGWHLASDSRPGMPGVSAHADWFDGWDPEIVETWVTNCLNALSDCHSHLLGDGRMIF